MSREGELEVCETCGEPVKAMCPICGAACCEPHLQEEHDAHDPD